LAERFGIEPVALPGEAQSEFVDDVRAECPYIRDLSIDTRYVVRCGVPWIIERCSITPRVSFRDGERQTISVRDIVIKSSEEFKERGTARQGALPVIYVSGQIRLRIYVLNFQCDRIERDVDRVVGKRLSRNGIIDGWKFRGIELAGPHIHRAKCTRCRYGVELEIRRVVDCFVDVKEEKQLIF
jgi:hypothetical protein